MTCIAPSVSKCLRYASHSGRQAKYLLRRSFSLSDSRLPAVSHVYQSQLSTPLTEPSSDADRLYASVILTVKGSDEAVLDSYTQFVTRAATVMNLDITGRVVIPMNIEKKTLLASPHIFKKARVQYELRTHGRMFQINRLTGDTADVFLEYIQRNLPEGVSMAVEQEQVEPLPEFFKASSSTKQIETIADSAPSSS